MSSLFGSKPTAYANLVIDKHFDKPPFDFLPTSLCCDSIDGKNKYKLGIVINNNNGTQMADVRDFDNFAEICNNLYNKDCLIYMKQLCSFLPIRSKGINYIKYGMELYKGVIRDKIVEDDSKNEIIRKYTSDSTDFFARLNILLALDYNLHEVDKSLNIQYGEYIKQLKCCIGWQKPKYSGVVYRGTNMTPLELFTCLFKDIFYIPSFTSTSIKKDVALGPDFKGNVLMEIDLKDFNLFSTIIQKQQSDYNESECLLSCYNIYKFVSLTLKKGSPSYIILRIKTLNYIEWNDMENHNIKGVEHGDFPLKYLKSGSQLTRSRNLSPEKLHEVFIQLCDDHHKSKK